MALPSNTVQQQGQGVQNADQMNTNVQAVTSLTALRDFTALGSMMIYLQGYSSPGDGGQGAFYFNANATGPDDGVNIIVPTGAAQGAWIRLPTSIPGLLIYATLPTGTTDTWSPIGYASPVDAIVIITDSGGSTLAGLTGGVSDRRMVLANAGPGSLTITNGASGTAADNFILPNSASQVIPPNGALAFVYDAVNLGWRVLATFAGGGGGGGPVALVYVIDGYGSPLFTGVAGALYVSVACTITAVTLLADQTGDVVVDIWKAPLASYPPTITNTIVAADPPTISAAQSSQDTALTGWTTAVSAGDTLVFNVTSSTTLTRVTVTLSVTS